VPGPFARALLGQLDNPRATRQARRELLDVLTEAAYTGRPDFQLLERAVSAVFDAGTKQIRRGHRPSGGASVRPPPEPAR
jgi:hypothetical protein